MVNGLYDIHNPNAFINTTMRAAIGQSIEDVYKGNGMFKSVSTSKNESIVFVFEKPIRLKRYFIIQYNSIFTNYVNIELMFNVI